MTSVKIKNHELVPVMHHKWNCGCLLKLGFLCGYGALASVALALYNNPREEDPNFFLQRLILGGAGFPLSRMTLQLAYYVATGDRPHSATVSGVAGAICGFLFSSRELLGDLILREEVPSILMSAVCFAGGAILVDLVL